MWVCFANTLQGVLVGMDLLAGVLLAAIFRQGIDAVSVRLIIAEQERAAAGEQGGEHGVRVSGKAVLTETSIGPGCCLPRSNGARVAGEPGLSLFA